MWFTGIILVMLALVPIPAVSAWRYGLKGGAIASLAELVVLVIWVSTWVTAPADYVENSNSYGIGAGDFLVGATIVYLVPVVGGTSIGLVCRNLIRPSSQDGEAL